MRTVEYYKNKISKDSVMGRAPRILHCYTHGLLVSHAYTALQKTHSLPFECVAPISVYFNLRLYYVYYLLYTAIICKISRLTFSNWTLIDFAVILN